MSTPARYVQVLMRGLGIPQEQASALARQIIPTVLLDDLSNPWESDEFSIGWGVFGTLITAVAAETSQYAIENPPSSGKLVVVRNMETWSTTNAGLVGFSQVPAAEVSTIAVSSNRVTLDGRHPGSILAQRGLTAVTRAESDPALSNEGVRVDLAAGQVWSVPQLDMILAPGQAFLLEWETVNIPTGIYATWFELPQVLPVG